MTDGKTTLNADEVRNAGKAIADLANEVNSYSDISAIQPKAGEFEVGTWLNNLVTARRDVLHEHTTELSSTFQEVGQQLQNIASNIEQVDQNNADQVNKLHSELDQTMSQMRTRLDNLAPNLTQGTGDTASA